MDISSLFTLPDDWIVLSCEQGGKAVVVSAKATASISSCPLCHQPSDRIHSHYTRTIADLPCIGQSLCLKVRVRRFRCLEPDCPRKIFTERIPSFVRPSARMTKRLQATVQSLGLATTGEEGSRLASVLHIQVSAPTIIRRIMNLVLPPPSSVTALGIDDFSFRRGQTFGTILVDLERHIILDILPQRSVESAIQWMKNHPEIQFVSRDRGQEYTQAAMLGAPQAVAIADRFYLYINLIEAVEPVVARCCKEIRTDQPLPSLDLALPRVKEWKQERTTYWQERTADT